METNQPLAFANIGSDQSFDSSKKTDNLKPKIDDSNLQSHLVPANTLTNGKNPLASTVLTSTMNQTVQIQPNTMGIQNAMTAVNQNAQNNMGTNILVNSNSASTSQSVMIATQPGQAPQYFITPSGQQVQFMNQNPSRSQLQTIQHSGALTQVGPGNIIFTNAGPANSRTPTSQQYVQIPSNMKLTSQPSTLMRPSGTITALSNIGGQRQVLMKPENGTMQLMQPGFVKFQTSAGTQIQQIHQPGGIRQQIMGQNIVQLPMMAAPGQQGLPRGMVQGSQQPQMIVQTSQANAQASLQAQASSVAANNAGAAQSQQQMSPVTAKQKCKNFFSTLIRLANDQGEETSKNVNNLIQGLVDDTMRPEDFTTALQKELNSAEQPCLVPFLKRSLPFLRCSLMQDEMTIEGIRKPPNTAYTLSGAPSPMPNQLHTQQTMQAPQQTRLVRLVQPGGPGLMPGQQILTQIPATNSSGGSIIFNPQSLGPGIINLNQQGGIRPNLSNINNLISTPRLPQPSTTVDTKLPTVNTTSVVVTAPPTTAKAAPKTTTPKPKSASAKKAKPKKDATDTTAPKASSNFKDDDDYNDVAAMGGVNLLEESQKILAANSEMIGQQIRSCKDETLLPNNTLHQRVLEIMKRYELSECSPDVVTLLSHAIEERMKTVVNKLSAIAEHRQENLKMNSKYTVVQDVKSQVQFLQELDRIEKKKHEEQEREVLIRAAKSRSKLDDPDQAAIKARAKEMQRQELEEIRQKEANETAMRAIGKKRAGNFAGASASSGGLNALSSSNTNQSNNSIFGSSSKNSSQFNSSSGPMKRIKRVIMKDVHFLLEHERDSIRSTTLYKALSK